jgi:2-oxo-3-hexenedioate decarboxylase
MTDLDAIANELLAAYDHSRLLMPPAMRGPFTIADAYTVGTRLVAMRRARGERTVGRKIGFTNTTIWEAYGVDRPLWAHVYAGTVTDAPAGEASISLAHCVAPRIEPEIVFGLTADVPPGTTDPRALLRQIAWYARGFEIVDCHFPDWRFTSADCAADFGLHAQLVIGPRLPITHMPAERLMGELASFTLNLHRNDALAASGGGAHVLGSPLHALAYLVETLAALDAEPLAAGEVITTGTLTPALPIAAGECWSTTVQGLAAPDLALNLER